MNFVHSIFMYLCYVTVHTRGRVSGFFEPMWIGSHGWARCFRPVAAQGVNHPVSGVETGTPQQRSFAPRGRLNLATQCCARAASQATSHPLQPSTLTRTHTGTYFKFYLLSVSLPIHRDILVLGVGVVLHSVEQPFSHPPMHTHSFLSLNYIFYFNWQKNNRNCKTCLIYLTLGSTQRLIIPLLRRESHCFLVKVKIKIHRNQIKKIRNYFIKKTWRKK